MSAFVCANVGMRARFRLVLPTPLRFDRLPSLVKDGGQ
jgi:hypothetical protein